MYVHVAVCWSQPPSVLLFSNEEQKQTDSTRSAKQAFSTVRVFKVFSLDAAHDGRHAVCAECLNVCVQFGASMLSS